MQVAVIFVLYAQFSSRWIVNFKTFVKKPKTNAYEMNGHKSHPRRQMIINFHQVPCFFQGTMTLGPQIVGPVAGTVTITENKSV